jgi:hypothetical protein
MGEKLCQQIALTRRTPTTKKAVFALPETCIVTNVYIDQKVAGFE